MAGTFSLQHVASPLPLPLPLLLLLLLESNQRFKPYAMAVMVNIWCACTQLRFYAVDSAGRMGFIAQPEACTYALSDLRDYLLTL